MSESNTGLSRRRVGAASSSVPTSSTSQDSNEPTTSYDEDINTPRTKNINHDSGMNSNGRRDNNNSSTNNLDGVDEDGYHEDDLLYMESSHGQKLTLMEEVFLLGLKDRQVSLDSQRKYLTYSSFRLNGIFAYLCV